MKYTEEEIAEITSRLSVLDYFLYLEHQGKVKFEKKTGSDAYFRTEDNKFSVSETQYYDFKTGQGGKLIKAVMALENKSWKDALDFLADFSNLQKVDIAERKNEFKKKGNNTFSEIKIQYSGIPNNEKLLSYFEQRGISNEILQNHTRQIHYENGGKKYFGIGIENVSGGFEIRNPIAKIKIGKADITEVKGTKDEIVVFEGMADMLSFLELQKLNGYKNSRTLVSLNSVTNVDSFLSKYKDYQGKIFLCLDGDKAGDLATNKILSTFSQKNIKDIRAAYHISENENNDLNDYLRTKKDISQNNTILNTTKNQEDVKNTIESKGISETQQMEPGESRENTRGNMQKVQPIQVGNNDTGHGVGSNDAGNGLASTERSNLGRRRRRSIDNSQQNDAGKNGEREHSLGGILSGGTVSDRTINSTYNDDLDVLLSNLQGKKITNEDIKKAVSEITFVSSDNKIELFKSFQITEELKDICNQYKSGGVAKEGRGILDEYYTNDRIVDAIRNLIQDNFKNQKNIRILEPSVGTGNFLNLTKELGISAFVTAFEINDTTAKIAKIFHPEAEINLRSFESEFIDENGIKANPRDFKDQYDLVIGNPPYGEHRGFYKGLGEEPNISKYEDYFVKRSLDVLKENGTLAMVLPSGWLNRQKKLNNAEVSNAFRLPVGAFSGTQVGTDIIILKKNSQNQALDISNYFKLNPEKILGETKEKSNRFGRLEEYVDGNLDEALKKIQKLQNKKETERIGNLFEDLFKTNTETLSDVEKNQPVETKINPSNSLEAIKEKLSQALRILDDVKYKTPAVKKQIKIFENQSENLDTYTTKDLEKLLKSSERIIENYSKSEDKKEYEIQSKPEISKKILKYQFAKDDEIVNASLQNSTDISQPELKAFRDTSYDGTLNNPKENAQFANYIDGKWMHDFYYAEGNIYAKLAQLEIDFADKISIGGLPNQYEKQKAILEAVLPKAKTLDEIIISPNHEFVHKFDLGKVEKDFYNQFTRSYSKQEVEYNLAEKFKDFVSKLPHDAFQGSSSWEVKGFVDNETVTGSDKERNALVRERRKLAANDLFSKFLREELSDDLRNRFVKDFNRDYNNIHVPDYSKFPLFSKIHKNFKDGPLKLTEVQKAGVGRQTTKGVGLLAHEVGFGKTLSGVLSMHEAMERGNAKRPLIAVPNESILKQWVDTIYQTIPNAKVNVLGNLGKDYDLSKFDNKDGEITLVTYEGFNNIGFSKEVTEHLASKFNYISASELKSVTNTERDTQKELQKEKEIEGKMKSGKIYDWEDFKFDHLTFDEVHNANHIVGKVKIEDRRFSSDFRNQNQQTSKLGINTWMAAQYIQDKHDGRNITLLSATPFTNKPLEYYSILSLIANKRLEEKGYFNVNTFFETFMEADNDMEIDAKGDVKFKSNVRRFKNNTLFQQLLSEFIDIKGEDDNPELVRPNKINKEYKIEQSDLTKEQYDLLNESFNESQKGAILTHILNARLIAISPYLSPFYEGEMPSSIEFVKNSEKLKETMDLIAQNKKDIPNAGQIIYSELAVSEFPKLKEYLIKEIGFKPEEIGIITGSTTKPNRLKIQDDFNDGKVKVVIGSEAIQEGMNLQEKTTDTYLLSLPYNFTALRQVEGRSWRQGNENENVRMNFMLTNDSIDVFMLQKLQAKQARYLEAMKKGADVLDISDIDTHELKTAIITNPETRANIEIELLNKKLEVEKSKLLADQAFVLRKFETFNKYNEEVRREEQQYARIVGYSNNGDSNSDYWKSQLPNYQRRVDAAKEFVKEVIIDLASKGVNVEEIENQTKFTDDKVADIQSRIENLPDERYELIEKYKIEKYELQKKNEGIDNIKDRSEENNQLFKQNKEIIAVTVEPQEAETKFKMKR